MAIETPRHPEFACDETHPGMGHTDWIAMENRTGGTDNSEEAAFIGKISVPELETDTDAECGHHGTRLIRMDGVSRHDEGWACGKCGLRFVPMQSHGAYHAVELVYHEPPIATEGKERHIPREVRLDGLKIKGVVDMTFKANLQGDARKIVITLIANSFDEIVEPKDPKVREYCLYEAADEPGKQCHRPRGHMQIAGQAVHSEFPLANDFKEE